MLFLPSYEWHYELGKKEFLGGKAQVVENIIGSGFHRSREALPFFKYTIKMNEDKMKPYSE